MGPPFHDYIHSTLVQFITVAWRNNLPVTEYLFSNTPGAIPCLQLTWRTFLGQWPRDCLVCNWYDCEGLLLLLFFFSTWLVIAFHLAGNGLYRSCNWLLIQKSRSSLAKNTPIALLRLMLIFTFGVANERWSEFCICAISIVLYFEQYFDAFLHAVLSAGSCWKATVWNNDFESNLSKREYQAVASKETPQTLKDSTESRAIRQPLILASTSPRAKKRCVFT